MVANTVLNTILLSWYLARLPLQRPLSSPPAFQVTVPCLHFFLRWDPMIQPLSDWALSYSSLGANLRIPKQASYQEFPFRMLWTVTICRSSFFKIECDLFAKYYTALREINLKQQISLPILSYLCLAFP